MQSSVISPIFVLLAEIIGSFGETFLQVFDQVTEIFFVSSGDGVVITPIGQLLLCGFGIGLVWIGIRWLTRLVKMRG